MKKKCFVLHEEVIYVFHERKYIPKIEKLSFYLADVKVLGSMKYGKTINDYLHDSASKNNIKLKEYCASNSFKQPV